jgi:hypothetical protein
MPRLLSAICCLITLAPAAAAQDAPPREGWVVLSTSEYRDLRARAFPAPPDPAPPPVDATLTRTEYDLRLAGDTVAGQARLTVDVLKDGWVTVQAPAGILIRDARLDGQPTPLADGEPPRVLLSRRGRSILTLDVVVPLTASSGSESFALPPSGSALSVVRLTVPRAGIALAVEGGFVADQAETAAESRWVVHGVAGRPMSFSWKRRSDDRRSTLPLRTRAHVTEIVALGEELSHVTASVRLEIVQGATRQMAVALPPGLVVNQVTGAGVGDWSVSDGLLTIAFVEPASAREAVAISGEVRLPREGSIEVPLLRVPAAEREVGGVAVDVAGAGEVEGAQPRGLEPADAADLGDVVAGRESPSMAAFRFTPTSGAAPRSLSVQVSRYTPQAVLVANVEEARYNALASQDGKLLVRARYAVRNNQRSFLAVTLPADSVLWSASLAGTPVRPGIAAGGGLLLPLRRSRGTGEAPAFVVELVYLQRVGAWQAKGSTRIHLPAVDLPISRTGLTLRHSPLYEIELVPAAFRQATDTGPWSPALRDVPAGPPPPPPPAAARPAEPGADLRALVDRQRNESGRTRQGQIPIAIDFPEFGPAVFFAAELTAETQPAVLDLSYRQTGGR